MFIAILSKYAGNHLICNGTVYEEECINGITSSIAQWASLWQIDSTLEKLMLLHTIFEFPFKYIISPIITLIMHYC